MRLVILAFVAGLVTVGGSSAQVHGSGEDQALWCKAINEELYGIGALNGAEADRAEAQQRTLEAKADAALTALGLSGIEADSVRESYAAEAEMQAADFANGAGKVALRLDYAACF